jgi:hypothetical protein
MLDDTKKRRFGKFATLAVAGAALGAVALPLSPANAQMYLGWDFGNGFGIGIGTPPSALGMHYCGLTPTFGPCRNFFPF